MPAFTLTWRATFWPRLPVRHAAEHDLVHLLGLHAGTLQGFLHHGGAQVHGGHVLQAAAEGANSGTAAVDNIDFFHVHRPPDIFLDFPMQKHPSSKIIPPRLKKITYGNRGFLAILFIFQAIVLIILTNIIKRKRRGSRDRSNPGTPRAFYGWRKEQFFISGAQFSSTRKIFRAATPL